MKKNEEQAVVTKSGYETLSKELKFLRTTRTQEVADKIEEARSHGDLSENAEYTAGKDEQAKIESRIRELENILSNVKVVDVENLDTTRVAIGLTVTLEDIDRPGKVYKYTLVGSEELSGINLSGELKIISQKSPVGQAILGHVAGDEVVFKIPKGMRRLKILSIAKE